MTDQTPITLGDEDGAIVFRADGTYEVKLGNKAKELIAPDHLVLMIGLHGLLDLEEFREDVMAMVDDVMDEDGRTEKVWSN